MQKKIKSLDAVTQEQGDQLEDSILKILNFNLILRLCVCVCFCIYARINIEFYIKF